MTISSEDFAIWKAQPITAAVLQYVLERQQALQDQWLAHSWTAGICDPLVLAEARGGAAMANAILELTAEELSEVEE